MIGTVIAGAWIIVAFTAQWWVPYGPNAQVLPRLQAPGIDTLLGTDGNGRDIFSRLMTGATVSLPLALMLVIAAMIIGTTIGAVAGYFGGWVDETLMRITDLFMAFPTVILAMVVAASLGPSLFNAVIAARSWSPGRSTRASPAASCSDSARQNHVIAGRLLGHSPLRTLFVDILPNIAGPVLVLATLDIGAAILLLSGLSFLGLGAQPPTAEWGSMISAAMQNFDAWWLGVFPGLAILTVVLAFNFLGDAMRDILDPTAEVTHEKQAEHVASAKGAAA